MGNRFSGGREIARLSNRALKQSGEDIDGSFRRLTEIVEFFQRHFVPVDQGGEPLVESLIKAFMGGQDEQMWGQQFPEPGA